MQPCEVIVQKIIPSLRAEIAKKLIEQGFSQQKVSDKLEITPAAVSQYVSGKRGKKIELSKEIKEKIKQEAKEIKENNEKDLENVVCMICEEIKQKEVFCELLEEFEEECEGCGY